MLLVASAALGLVSVAAAANFPSFKHLVAFGDSYTDEGRLSYFFSHNDTLPPTGWSPPVSNSTSTGGYIWPRMIANSTGLTLHDYAVSGASCSNLLTPRSPYPSVKEYEVPQFLKEYKLSNQRSSGNIPTLDPDEVVITIWIGTNDIGNGALLDHSQVPGVSLVNVTSCAIDAISTLYASGARNFIFQNLAPLYLAPQYATDARFGVGVPNHYWPTKNTFLGGNNTLISDSMREEVLSANEIYKYRLPALAATLPEAKIALFSSHDLISDIIYNPKNWISAPYNTTGYHYHCNVSDNCATSYIYDQEDWNSYVWYDELHPSERTDRIIADEIIKTFKKQSKYATYYF
ncbi:hypothetical protein DL93DRAFT_2087555 [Clavulina sp. PMI_390]|nr:hypothetical protein DL93DRAFT_2087555 [Clavulina sp. PMI_390]